MQSFRPVNGFIRIKRELYRQILSRGSPVQIDMLWPKETGDALDKQRQYFLKHKKIN